MVQSTLLSLLLHDGGYMSLQVHLPLIRDLSNLGVSDVSITNTNASLNSNGKLGGCYSFSSAKLTNTFATPVSSSIGSLSCWAKFNALPSSSGWFTLLQLGNLGGYATCRLGLYMEYNKYINVSVDGSSTATNRYEHSFTTNTWYHLCTTNDGTIVKLYIDGIEVMSKTATKGTYTTAAASLYVGGTNNFYLNGFLNDVRYYNHVLSPADVKELSKGLVIHYKLSSNNTNLFDFESLASKWVTDGATCSNYSDSEYGNVLKIVSSSGSKRIYRNLSNVWKSGQIYTVSFLARADDIATCNMSRSIADYSPNFTLDKEWRRYVGQITSTVTTGGGTLSFTITTTGVNVYITQIKLELGDQATPYSPGVGDPAYTLLGYDSTEVIDSSGYGYNGTKSGSITISADSPRYDTSTIFNGTNTYIEAEPLPSETKTISIWTKTSWVSSSGYRLAVHDKHTGLAIGWSSSQLITYVGSSNGGSGSRIDITTTNYKANQWNHIVVVKTGATTRDVYVNGVLATPASANYWGGDLDKLNIGNRHLSGSYSGYFDGQLSDFRTYATALSADDIKELYEVSAGIDSKNNSYCAEYMDTESSRELLAINYTTVHNSTTTTYTLSNSDGELYFDGYSSAGSAYIPIDPTGKTYYYDYTISVAAGNQFYIGITRFDKDKTPRSNEACVYISAIKPSSDLVKTRYKGTVNLSTDGVNPCAYIKLRILNAWSGTTSESTKKATIHQLSLREVVTASGFDKTEITSKAQIKADTIREQYDGVAIEKEGLFSPNIAEEI
jgi:hypothetical protein